MAELITLGKFQGKLLLLKPFPELFAGGCGLQSWQRCPPPGCTAGSRQLFLAPGDGWRRLFAAWGILAFGTINPSVLQVPGAPTQAGILLAEDTSVNNHSGKKKLTHPPQQQRHLVLVMPSLCLSTIVLPLTASLHTHTSSCHSRAMQLDAQQPALLQLLEGAQAGKATLLPRPLPGQDITSAHQSAPTSCLWFRWIWPRSEQSLLHRRCFARC